MKDRTAESPEGQNEKFKFYSVRRERHCCFNIISIVLFNLRAVYISSFLPVTYCNQLWNTYKTIPSNISTKACIFYKLEYLQYYSYNITLAYILICFLMKEKVVYGLCMGVYYALSFMWDCWPRCSTGEQKGWRQETQVGEC